MKAMGWRGFMPLLMMQSCLAMGSMLGQAPGVVPPKNMRLCVTVQGKVDCVNLVWISEFYEGRRTGETKLENRYWVTGWEDGHIQLTGKTAYAVGGAFPLDASIDAQIAPDGAHSSGNLDWRIGYSSSGSVPFTLTWSKDPSNAREVEYVGQFQSIHYSKTNPDIILPPGASEAYIAYPPDVRALLQADYAISPQDALRRCHDPSVVDGNLALEIARYAYRAAEVQRGNCWTTTASELGSVRAKTLNAVGWQMGWWGSKDDTKAFEMLKSNMSTREPWDLLFLMNAYLDGRGTPKDSHQASIITSYMITHDDTMAVTQMVGSDDDSLNRQKARLQLLMNPPMKSVTHCSQAYVTPGGIKVPSKCNTSSVVDNDALQQQLDKVESKK